MSAPRMLALAFAMLAAVLITGIIMAASEESLAVGLAELAAAPWGIVTLIDLYVGLIFIAVWIAWLERSWPRSLLWIIALAGLGHLATAIYVVWRGMHSPSLPAFFAARRGV